MSNRHTVEVYKDHAGAYRYRLRASNGQIGDVSGEGYTRRWSARRAAKKTFPEFEVVNVEK